MGRKSFEGPLPRTALLVFFLLPLIGNASANKEGYYGKFIGKLSQLHHGVSGDVFAVDARTLHLRNFNYDGEGPAAYFYAGNTKGPGPGGFRVRDERGTTNVLPRYRNKHITITLPEGKTLQNIRWFSVWCDEFSVNFGDVKIPKNLDFPKPQKINGLSGVHGVSSEPIVIVDAQTLLVPGFSYDGEAPDAKFWVGRGFKPSPQGIRIPDENGKEVPLRRYDRKTIVLTLPGDLTIFDIGHFGVWCEAFTVDFGHVQIPSGLNIPPSLKMLGVSPQSKLNCEVLWDDFAYEVRWAVAGDSIVLQLVARLENNEYMSFGISGDSGRSRMVGGDVVVAWVDKESLKGYAADYYLDAKSQCSGGRGSCPDENIAAGTDSVRLLNAALVNGYSIVTFQRSLKDQDELDKPVLTNGSQPVIWAIGPLNSRKEVSYHSLANRGDIFIDFGRSPKWNCPTPESMSDQPEPEDASDGNPDYDEPKVQDTRKQDVGRRESPPKTAIPTPAPAPKSDAWEIPPIKCYEPEDGVFYAQMGPTGGKHGYSAITGHVGWGISWYINGLLIPEINVVRGRTYTFIVEGGLDPETPARYHPFYITDDPVGGYQYKTPQERANIQIFAGAVQNRRGEVRPTGVGRLCNWTPDPNQPPADEFTSFGAYQRTLRLECDPGNPGIIQWTVDKDTPDTVYYQCYTHRYLGWKINVHDHCEGEAASDPVPSVAKAPPGFLDVHRIESEGEGEAEAEESINYEVRVKPDDKFLESAFQKNQTLGLNEFAEYNAIYKHRPEPVALHQPSRPNLEESFKSPDSERQVIVGLNTRIPPSFTYLVGPQLGQGDRPPQRQPLNISDAALFSNGFFIHPGVDHAHQLAAYNVGEQPAPENVQGFQNFQILPVSASLPGLMPSSHAIIPEPLRHEIDSVKTFRVPEILKNHKELPKFHQTLNIRKENKITKANQKPGIHSKLENTDLPLSQHRPQPGQTGQARPLVTYRPSRPSPVLRKPPNRPAPAGFQKSQLRLREKTPHLRYRPEPLLEAERFASPELKKTPPFKVRRQEHKRPQGPPFGQEPRPTDLLGAAGTNQAIFKEVPFARNSGFDPKTVQVEGGFKPILNTGIAPVVGLIDRIDVLSEEETNADVEAENSLRRDEDKTYGAGKGKEQREGNDTGKKNLFRNSQAQTFEPIFVPSVPDDALKNKHENQQTRTSSSLKRQSDPFQHRDPQKSGRGKIKTGVDSHPVPGASPYTEDDQKDISGAAESIEVKNESLARGDGAKNIFEVMEAFEKDGASRETGKGAEGKTDEIAMADERKDFYLPPGADRFLSYDGKVVKAVPAPALPAARPASDVYKLPQFVPFRGVAPPLGQAVNVNNLPQLRTSKLARHDILPPPEAGPRRSDLQTIISKGASNSQGDETEPAKRARRSPDHVPGHEGHHDHDHDHDHDHHHHHPARSRSSTLAVHGLATLCVLRAVFPFVRL